ncbi:MAG: hypothetical protein FJX37_01170 [Alphaproteobacteria bacterium]|nr:hypothetical protein [Alphaproteobacteria bacterium]MBM3950676.1 hypothetical protein [Rhodospirillales bacterium]
MDILLIVLLFAVLYLIVYYRITIGYWRAKATGQEESGFLAAISFPVREGLPREAVKYYWRYWVAVAALLVILGMGTAYRLPALREALRGLG